MKLSVVSDRRSQRDFNRVPKFLYKDDPFWVCPQIQKTVNIFDPRKNKLVIRGNARRWILRREDNVLIGRIAAFYNRDLASRNKLPAGGIGWFECINDQAAANLLFDVSRDWLKEQGMEAMDDPINFGGNDSNWGLLIDGFSQPGFGMPYNLPYYRDLFENYGFRPYFQQYCYHVDLTKPFPERFWRIAKWVVARNTYEFRHVTWDQVDKFAQDVVTVFNSAWSKFKEDFRPMDADDLSDGIRHARTILEEDLVWFVYQEGEPIAFFIIFPDANQILKHMNGRVHLINKLRFLYHLKTRKISRVRAMAAGVVPKYQNKGIESGIFKKLEHAFTKKYWITEIELSWVGDFNPKIRSMYEAVGGELAKKHLTYRYMFDRNAKFERYMPEYMDKYKQKHSGVFQEEITYDAN